MALRAVITQNLASVYWIKGEQEHAHQLLGQFGAFAPNSRDLELAVLAPMIGAAHTGLGSILYEWNDLAAAEAHLRQGIELGNQGMGLRALVLGYYGLGRVLLAQRNWGEAAEIIQQAEQLAQTLGSELLLAVVASTDQPVAVDQWT